MGEPTKGVDDNYDTYFGEVTLDDLEADPITSIDNDFDPETQLCIPQDRLEDIEFFPNFCGDFISSNDFLWRPKHKNTSSSPFPVTHNKESKENTFPVTQKKESEDNINVKADSLIQFSDKKPRSKRHRTRFSGVHILDMSKYIKKRRCSHCQAEKTPQWRMGPMGPKTLCNACGVRYKSGRLVPEYRPAASPSFDTFKHSNFHRKIMKRKTKID